jgi:hypothetical protein
MTQRRLSKRTIKVASWMAGAVAFLAPLGVIRAMPRLGPPAPQVVYVPAGAQIVIQPGPLGTAGVKVQSAGVALSRTKATAPVAVTGGSHPPR